MLVATEKVKNNRFPTRSAGLFMNSFLRESGAVPIKSKEPAAAWLSTPGSLCFVSVATWAARSKSLPQPPAILRVHVNHNPPPGLFYAMRSRDVRQRLGLDQNAPLSLQEAPKIELVLCPHEADKLGEWLSSWVKDQLSNTPVAPISPYKWSSAEAEYDFAGGDDGRWRHYQSLWTSDATVLAANWYKECANNIKAEALRPA